MKKKLSRLPFYQYCICTLGVATATILKIYILCVYMAYMVCLLFRLLSGARLLAHIHFGYSLLAFLYCIKIIKTKKFSILFQETSD